VQRDLFGKEHGVYPREAQGCERGEEVRHVQRLVLEVYVSLLRKRWPLPPRGPPAAPRLHRDGLLQVRRRRWLRLVMALRTVARHHAPGGSCPP
jgi:hypothetical protein